MKAIRKLIWVSLAVLILAPIAAVVLAADCPEIVRTALRVTDELCEHTGRNQACYGHALLDAQTHPGNTSFVFDNAGDVVNVTDVQSLRLWPMEQETGVWGVALMRLQANLPSNENTNVTLLTFGDVQIENAVELPTQMIVTVAVNEFINVRRGPSTHLSPVGVLGPGATVKAIERLADNSWLRVEMPVSGAFGWVYTPLLSFEGDLNTLNITESWTPHYRPMQAFYFNSGAPEENCSETPSNGMLIQTPEGVGEVTLLINEVNIRIGSTVFFQAQAGGQMTVTTVEGHATVTANRVTHTAPAGSWLSIPLTAEMTPAGPPSMAQPYDGSTLQSLPIDGLEREIEVAEPATQEEIDAANAPPVARCDCQEDGGDGAPPTDSGGTAPLNGGDGAPPTDSSGTTPLDGGDSTVPTTDPAVTDTTTTVTPPTDVPASACPGQSCNAPGQGGECPGNSCDNPANSNGNANGNANGNSNGNSNGSANGNSNGRSNGNTNGNSNGSSNGSGNGNSNDNSNGSSNGNSNG